MKDSKGRAMLPPCALANDMMVYYAPRTLYSQQVTVMEMICASVCLTSMRCFSLEKKYRGERAFDEKVHMNNHRMGARGNATSFPLPWQDLLLQLKNTESRGDSHATPLLPRSGHEQSTFVSVLLKTSDEGDSAADLSKFVHQAIVRRHVVVQLIQELHDCGHRSYKNLNMTAVREKAERTLPENGVPPEVSMLLPYDSLLDNIQVQKQATPVSGHASLEHVATRFDTAKPNAVVLEKKQHR